MANLLLILQTNDIPNLIQNVIALMVIATADKLLATTLKDEVLMDLLSNESF